jgi:hypothetical protein
LKALQFGLQQHALFVSGIDVAIERVAGQIAGDLSYHPLEPQIDVGAHDRQFGLRPSGTPMSVIRVILNNPEARSATIKPCRG